MLTFRNGSPSAIRFAWPQEGNWIRMALAHDGSMSNASMATAETVDFLQWLRRDGNDIRCLGQGESWKQWVSGEGFDPELILVGLRELNDTSDLSAAFLHFVETAEQDEQLFSSWIDTLLLEHDPAAAELTGVAGGTQTKSNTPLASIQHYKQHLQTERREIEAIQEDQDFYYSKSWGDSWVQFSKDPDGTNLCIVYDTKKGDGQLNVFKDKYGWYNTGWNVNGWFIRYHDHDRYYSLNIADSSTQDWIITSNRRLLIGATDVSLLTKAGTLEKRSEGIAAAMKQAWNSDVPLWNRDEILQSKEVKNLREQHGEKYRTAKAYIERLNAIDYKSLSFKKKAEIYYLDKETVKVIQENDASIQAKKKDVSKTIHQLKGVISSIAKLRNAYNQYLTKAGKLEERAEGITTTINQAWNSDVPQWNRDEILQSKKAESLREQHGEQYKTVKAYTERLNAIDYRHLDIKQATEVFHLDREAVKAIQNNRTSLEAKKEDVGDTIYRRTHQAEAVISNIVEVRNAYNLYLTKAANLVKQAEGIETAMKQTWNSGFDQWTRDEILQTKKAKNLKLHRGEQYKTAKAYFEKLNAIDYRHLDIKKETEVFHLDKETVNAIQKNKTALVAKEKDVSDTIYRRTHQAEAVISNIETLQQDYAKDRSYYSKEKQPVEDYFTLFGRLRGHTQNANSLHRVHYANYSNQIKWSKADWKKGNHDFAENYLKKRSNFAAKREEMFGKSEAHAVKAAIATYDVAKMEGNPRKVCLAMATETYVQTLATEDVDFLLKKRDRYEAARDKWNSMTTKERRKYDRTIDEFLNEGLLRSGHGNDRRQADLVGDVLLSVGADILERQVDVAKKAYRDQQRRFSALRLELLVSRLTMEYTMAERYDNWYAHHPQEQYHPVKKWFAHAWHDIWYTLTLPYRAVAAEIKAWKSGEGFWAGMKAGWKVEGNILHQDLHSINHIVKGFHKMIAPLFDWIPGVKKFVEFENLVGRAIESIPFHIAKNVTSLGKQLYRVVTLQASLKGIWDGLGRDTRGIRHLIRHINWLAHDVLTGNFKNIGEVISRDFNTAKKGVGIYMQRKEIKEALLIKRDELVARRKLHRHFHHLVKSPMRVITDDAVRNLKNDKAFVGFRQSLAASTDGKVVIKASSLYGTSFYKDAKKSAKELVKSEVDERITKLKNNISSIHEDLKVQHQTLKAEWKGMTAKQRDKKEAGLIYDYNHNVLWKTVVDYELKTTDGKKAGERLLADRAKLGYLARRAGLELKGLKKDVKSAVTSAEADFKSRQNAMDKKAQHWMINGGLLSWAQQVDKSFISSVKRSIAFLHSPQGAIVKAKALDAYFAFKDYQLVKKGVLPYLPDINKTKADLDHIKRIYDKALKEAKLYKEEQSYLLRQWKKWGVHDGKIALTAYDISLRPQFTVNYTTTPPTVTCSPLSVKQSKAVNAKITNKHLGEHFFMRLMWTQLLTSSFGTGTWQLGQSKTSLENLVKETRHVIGKMDAVLHRVVHGMQTHTPVRTISDKGSTFFSTHVILNDLLIYEDGSKIKAFRKRAELRVQSLADRMKNIHSEMTLLRAQFDTSGSLLTALRARVSKAVRRENYFIKLMNIQVSQFNKQNFAIFEHHQFGSLKMIELQAALAYDFDDNIKTKGGYTSRFKEMKSDAMNNNKTLSSDYSADKQEESQGADLTIGQALVSVEVAPSPIGTLTLKQQWQAINGSKSAKAQRSTSNGGSAAASGSSSGQEVKFRFKMNQQTSSGTTRKTTANVLLLWRNYELFTRLTKKTVKKAAEKAEKNAADVDSIKAEKNATDFDSITSQEVDASERRLNREAVRLDDDLDLFKDEVTLDEELGKDLIKKDTGLVDQDLTSFADHGTDGDNSLIPEGEFSNSIDGLDEFANGIIKTTEDETVDAVETTVGETEQELEGIEVTGEDFVAEIVV